MQPTTSTRWDWMNTRCAWLPDLAAACRSVKSAARSPPLCRNKSTRYAGTGPAHQRAGPPFSGAVSRAALRRDQATVLSAGDPLSADGASGSRSAGRTADRVGRTRGAAVKKEAVAEQIARSPAASFSCLYSFLFFSLRYVLTYHLRNPKDSPRSHQE